MTSADERKRIAYADPPYPGQAKRHYGMQEVNHAELMRILVEYDGWALSTSSTALREVIALAPPSVRIAAWVKPFAIFKPNVNPAYAWEPVLFKPARSGERDRPTVRDWVSANITLKRGLVGAKPEAFGVWLFELLGARPRDEFIDMFPGTGGVTAVWQARMN